LVLIFPNDARIVAIVSVPLNGVVFMVI
jgi:hypothetical protein